jgi:hypothetical protein
MQDCIELKEFKRVWLEKISAIKCQLDSVPWDQIPGLGSVDIGYLPYLHHLIILRVDDLINPPKDEKIEQEIDSIIVD